MPLNTPPYESEGFSAFNIPTSTTFNTTVSSENPLKQESTIEQPNNAYSISGFDVISILSRLADRPGKRIELGPVDNSCAFLISDARQPDYPIVYASPNFERLTGYSEAEVLGQNCRFLQAPDGRVQSGSVRQHTDNWAVRQLKFNTIDGEEQQVSLVNYKKNGDPFVNLVTVIPITYNGEIRYYLGLQVDMIEQPGAILDRMSNGTYAINYSNSSIPATVGGEFALGIGSITASNPLECVTIPSDLMNVKVREEQPVLLKNEKKSQFINWHQLLVDRCDHFVHVLSLRGVFLYASSSCHTLLGYAPTKLVHRPLSQFCHPGDVNHVLREIKSCSESQKLFSLIYRLKHATGQYMWFETYGKIHSDPNTTRKCIVLSAKPFAMPQMPTAWMALLGGPGDNDFWWRVTSEGLVLAATKGTEAALGARYRDCVGASLFQLIYPDGCLPLTTCLNECQLGRISGLRFFTIGVGGKFVEVEAIFYPTGPPPCHVLARCRVVNDTTGRQLPVANLRYPLSNGVASAFAPPYLFGELLPDHDRTLRYEVHRLGIDNARLRDELSRYERIERSNPNKAAVARDGPTRQCPQCTYGNLASSYELDGTRIDSCVECGWKCLF